MHSDDRFAKFNAHQTFPLYGIYEANEQAGGRPDQIRKEYLSMLCDTSVGFRKVLDI